MLLFTRNFILLKVHSTQKIQKKTFTYTLHFVRTKTIKHKIITCLCDLMATYSAFTTFFTFSRHLYASSQTSILPHKLLHFSASRLFAKCYYFRKRSKESHREAIANQALISMHSLDAKRFRLRLHCDFVDGVWCVWRLVDKIIVRVIKSVFHFSSTTNFASLSSGFLRSFNTHLNMFPSNGYTVVLFHMYNASKN